MLKQNKESALMSRELAQMKGDVSIDFILEDCKFGKFNKEKVEEVFNGLQFYSLVDRLSQLRYN